MNKEELEQQVSELAKNASASEGVTQTDNVQVGDNAIELNCTYRTDADFFGHPSERYECSVDINGKRFATRTIPFSPTFGVFPMWEFVWMVDGACKIQGIELAGGEKMKQGVGEYGI